MATGSTPDPSMQDALGKAMDVPSVIAAFLIGSQATGRAGPLSDHDVAVWLDPGLGPRERLAMRLRLLAAGEAVVGDGALDLVVLNDAPPLLQNRAGRDRIELVERDRRARVLLEADALVRYLDTAPLRAELAAGLAHRLEEGRFGRR
jgi:predicted nucleotidyltransferase